MRTYGGVWEPMGPCGDLLRPTSTYGDLLGLFIEAYGDLWGPIGTFGDL